RLAQLRADDDVERYLAEGEGLALYHNVRQVAAPQPVVPSVVPEGLDPQTGMGEEGRCDPFPRGSRQEDPAEFVLGRHAFAVERWRGLRALHLDLEFPRDVVEGQPRSEGFERRFDVSSRESGVFHCRDEVRQEVSARIPRHPDEVLRPDLPGGADVPYASEVHISGDLGAARQIPVPAVDRWVLSQLRVPGPSSPRRSDSNHQFGMGEVRDIGFEPEVKWVRPDLNRSRQHPKLVGFPEGRMTRGPRAQTKLPHGPAGDSNRLAAKNVFVRLVLADPHHGANDQEKEPGAAKQGRDEDAHGDEHDTHDDAGVRFSIRPRIYLEASER